MIAVFIFLVAITNVSFSEENSVALRDWERECVQTRRTADAIASCVQEKREQYQREQALAAADVIGSTPVVAEPEAPCESSRIRRRCVDALAQAQKPMTEVSAQAEADRLEDIATCQVVCSENNPEVEKINGCNAETRESVMTLLRRNHYACNRPGETGAPSGGSPEVSVVEPPPRIYADARCCCKDCTCFSCAYGHIVLS